MKSAASGAQSAGLAGYVAFIEKENIVIIDNRREDVAEIRQAYKQAVDSVSEIGRLLRTTDSGKYMWSADHKTAISGIKVILKKLRADVPQYDT